MNPLYEAVDIHGHEHLINFNYVTHIEHSMITNPGRHPCCGEEGSALIKVNMINNCQIRIACNHDSEDITEDFLNAYEGFFHRQAKIFAGREITRTQASSL